MRVETKCMNCNATISFYTLAEDRIKLAMHKGKFLTLQCKKCNQKNKYHVNELRAEPSKYLRLFLLLLFLGATAIIGYFVYDYLFRISNSYLLVSILGIVALPVTVYTIALRNLRLKRNAFNWHKLNEYDPH